MDLWAWRRLHCLRGFARSVWQRYDFETIDAGYCLDRYSIENENGNVKLSRP